MVLILTRKPSNRVNYIFRLLLEELLGISFRITHHTEEYFSFDNPRFSYGVQVPSGELFFGANDLLFETGISVKQQRYFDYEGSRAFFSVHEPGSALPFDVFATSFYLVSRYEEYLPHIKDEHGRFIATSSDAFIHGFLNKPLVNIWALKVREILENRFPHLEGRKSEYSFRPTFDVDAAFAYKHKGITRALGGFFNSLKRKDIGEVKRRMRVLLSLDKDPFDTFDYLFRIQTEYHLHPVYFILLADYGPRDKNIPVNNRQFIRLIKLLADYAEVGIHPSYASAEQPSRLEMEVNRLARILRRDVECSRQHFLRIEFPATYRNLINLEITDDFTMGYSDQTGFRASICTPFRFFDLDLDMETHLRVHPFAVMDGTLKDYMKLTPEQSFEIIKQLIQETRNVGGVFTPLWHNQSLSDQGEWQGWLALFEKMVKFATAK